MRTERREAKLRSVLELRQPDLTVVLENIHDPHNVSAILRTCDAVGVSSVALLYTVESFPKIGKKSSASALKWIEREKFTSVEECFNTLRTQGFAIFATHLAEQGQSLFGLNLTKKTALVFGNEHRGVSEEAMKYADGNFLIPQFGMLQSLNVSVACAVSLYEACRQRLASDQYNAPKYSPEEMKLRLEQWGNK